MMINHLNALLLLVICPSSSSFILSPRSVKGPNNYETKTSEVISKNNIHNINTFHPHLPQQTSYPSITVLKLKSNNYEKEEQKLDKNLKITNDLSSILTSIALACVIATTTLLNHPLISNAAAPPNNSLDTEKVKIVKGYKRLEYLLTNWEKETTICGRTDNPYIGCERSPEVVMQYLGFKSMNDPLFRADKTLIKLQRLVSDKDDAQYQDALDTWVEKAEEGSGMAFISSWGEANPGGGKDRVDMFIERSRKDVVDARDSLGVVIRILGLQVD